MGVSKTLAKIHKRFYWPGYSDDVYDFVHSCQTCRERRGPGAGHRRPRAPLQLWEEGSLFGRFSVDLAGPFRRSREGYRHALVAVEGLTSFPEIIPLKDVKSHTAARALVVIWARYGACRVLRTDQGREFEAEVLAEVLEIVGVERVRTTPSRPCANGRAEKMVQFLKDSMSKLVDESQADWPDTIPLLLMAYRGTPHSTLKHSPSELLYGKSIRLPADLATRPPEPAYPTSLKEYPAKLRDLLRRVRHDARLNRELASQAMKMRYDANTSLTDFRPGDKVWFFNPIRRKGLAPKLQRPWESGWVVTHTINEVLARIKKGRKLRCVHTDRLAADDRNDCPSTGPLLALLAKVAP
ncbi:Retrovirus-related Pol polyprotein from transposon 412 [Frankliniella fusca]|uniref:RNA-directed DNA polymerase n=1 Tax=Frankliniella fusca TaxID=407009 RepID=A0AAE1HJ28_9NEOP|nr:Retrovirus-related Pol polyprotein from transposon 412 [Frankliniella fusca]